MIFLKRDFFDYLFIVSAFVFLSFFMGCGKKADNKALGQTYFKMAFFEMSDASVGSSSQLQRALALVDKALHYDQCAHYYAFKATILFSLEQYDLGDFFFKKALACTSDAILRAEIMNNYACLMAQRGEYSAAKRIWKGLCKDPTYQTPEVAFVNLGKLYMESQRFEKAKRSFSAAVRQSPSYVDAHLYLAIAAQITGDSILSKKEREIVSHLEPNDHHNLVSAV